LIRERAKTTTDGGLPHLYDKPAAPGPTGFAILWKNNRFRRADGTFDRGSRSQHQTLSVSDRKRR